MKRFLIALIACLCIGVASAEVVKFRTTEFAIKENTMYGWSSWSSWQDSNILITIDMSNDVIVIYSPVTQRLKAIEGPYEYYDNDGAANAKFKCYDYVDNCYCYLRLRQQRNGVSQIYLEYSNIMYVYNVRRI